MRDLDPRAEPVLVVLEAGAAWVDGVRVASSAGQRVDLETVALAHVASTVARASGRLVPVTVSEGGRVSRYLVGPDGASHPVHPAPRLRVVPPLAADDLPAPAAAPGAHRAPRLRDHPVVVVLGLLAVLAVVAVVVVRVVGDRGAGAPTAGPRPTAPAAQEVAPASTLTPLTVRSVQAVAGSRSLTLQVRATRPARVVVRLQPTGEEGRDRVVGVAAGATTVQFDDLPAGRVTWRLQVPDEPAVSGSARVLPEPAVAPPDPEVSAEPPATPDPGTTAPSPTPSPTPAPPPSAGGVDDGPPTGPIDPDDP